MSRAITPGVAKRMLLTMLPDSELLRFIAYKPKLETWRKHRLAHCPAFDTRLAMYDYINRELVGNGPIQYLEFGVYKGETVKYFAEINKDPNSKFVGFDTFTGLPEDWISSIRTVKRATFDTGGEAPHSEDVRISFVKGLFQDTLPGFLKRYKPTGQLIINNDSDLYSSTLFVLTYANDILVPGTIIIFDEFYSVLHEFRAFEDYCVSYRRSYEAVAAADRGGTVAVRMQ